MSWLRERDWNLSHQAGGTGRGENRNGGGELSWEHHFQAAFAVTQRYLGTAQKPKQAQGEFCLE